jgi:uncharacterized protein (TIGR00251 family)
VLPARGGSVHLLDAEVSKKAPARGIDLAGLAVSEHPAAVRFRVHAKPRASRTAIVGVREGVLDVAIAAPPVEGEANAELVRALAEALQVARRDVSIVSGQSGKQKTIEVRGLEAAVLRARLAPPVQSRP